MEIFDYDSQLRSITRSTLVLSDNKCPVAIAKCIRLRLADDQNLFFTCIIKLATAN